MCTRPSVFLEGDDILLALLAPARSLEEFTCLAACDGAPLVPLLYILVNLSFNVAALTLLKRTSAVVASLVMTLSGNVLVALCVEGRGAAEGSFFLITRCCFVLETVPLGVWGFTWSLPYLGPPSKLPPGIWMGASILVCGLAVYNFSSQTVEAKAL